MTKSNLTATLIDHEDVTGVMKSGKKAIRVYGLGEEDRNYSIKGDTENTNVQEIAGFIQFAYRASNRIPTKMEICKEPEKLGISFEY